MKKLIKNILKEYNEKHIWNNNNLIHNVKPNTKTLRQIWDEIEVGKVYKIYGIYTANFIDWALEDQRVEVMDKDHRLLTVKVLDKIQMGAGQFRPGSRMFLTMGDDGDRVYITPVNDMVEGDDGLDWIKDIPEAKWDDDWKPEDLVGKTYKSTVNRMVGYIKSVRHNKDLIVVSGGKTYFRHIDSLRGYVKNGYIEFI